MSQFNIQSLPLLSFKKQLPFALAVIILLCLLGYFSSIRSIIEDTDRLAEQELSLKESYVDKKRQALNLAALEKQLNDIEVGFSELLKQLPTKVEIDDFVNEITKTAADHAVHVVSIRPGAESAGQAGTLIEIPLQVKLVGNYHHIAGMMGDLGALSRIVSTEQVRLLPIEEGKRISVEATIKTFRAQEQGAAKS